MDKAEAQARTFSGKFAKRDDQLAAILADPILGFGPNIRFDYSKDRFFIFDGVRWVMDNTELHKYMMSETTRSLVMNPGFSADDIKNILPLLDDRTKRSVLAAFKIRREIATDGNEWDIDPHLIGFNNTVLDLTGGTIRERPGEPELLVSKSVGVDFDPNADCPKFKWFINDIMSDPNGNPRPDLVQYLYRFLGYALLGHTKEQKFWMWVGTGANGKGVLARTIAHVLGEYADTPSDTLYMRTRQGSASSNQARPDLVRLQSVRFTYMSEPPGGQFNEELLKAHTGEDDVLARDLYKSATQMAKFKVSHKIVFLTNDPPTTDDTGISMRRRARVVQFERSYEKKPDKALEDILRTEKQGILNLMIANAVAYLQQGLDEPQEVSDWSEAYIRENDPLADFFDERCIADAGEKTAGGRLYKAYEEWAEARGLDRVSMNQFAKACATRYKKRRERSSNVYVGVRLLNAMELAENDGEDDG